MNTILITGANRGIGLELCRQLAARGDQVIAACRNANEELRELPVQVIENVDVTSDDSAASLAESLGGQQIDILVNNAGILTSESLDDLDFDRMRRQYEVNALGPLRITNALLGNLVQGSKVIVLSSRVGSMADNASGGIYGYRMSKAAVNMAAVNLALDLRPRGIPVMILHPGMVATEMTGRTGIAAADSAAGLIARMDELTMEQTGSFWHAEGYQLPW